MLRTLTRFILALLLCSFCWLSASSPATASPTLATLFSFSGTRPTNLGIHLDQLASCPSTPNCVSSFSRDSTHAIAPLTYSSNPEQAFAALTQIVQSQPRTKIIQSTDRYLYAEFTSKIMGFVDDVEFYLDRSAHLIQVRSASRLGESDLGVNRQRIESIRAQFQAKVV